MSKLHRQKVSGYESHTVSAAIAFGAIIMFVFLGALTLPGYLGLLGPEATTHPELSAALLLNISLIIFAWRRSADLKRSAVARVEAEARINHLAYMDDTTGMYNRRYLIERLAACENVEVQQTTLLMIDIDNFKTVNDLYGHPAGDELLREIARRINLIAPASSCCARLGGDEFAVLLQGRDAMPENAGQVAQHLLDEISNPIQLASTLTRVSASIGLSTCDSTEPSHSSLMQRSDMAMYVSKRDGKNRHTWFDLEMARALNERNVLESEMRIALADDQFVPYFQPLLDIKSGKVGGFEVLARWEHPTKGLIEPDTFISMAETTGMISELSFTVMRKALLVARSWPAELAISVNISPVQFKDPDLALHIIKLLAEIGFPANRLELEITESTLLENPDLTLTTVESLKNIGIRISLDDFGTGYASLTQLRSLPFDRIKIDKSFVSSLLDDEQSNAIVHAIATLGLNLHLPITAEGVETELIYERLKSLGCSDAQGWLFGKALPAEDTIRIFLQGEIQKLDYATPAADSVPKLAKDRRSFARQLQSKNYPLSGEITNGRPEKDQLANDPFASSQIRRRAI